jgi:hypothetical protein
MFTVSLAGTRQPNNTHLSVMASASVTENLNHVIRQLRDEDEWVWILGDDHVWESDCLNRMLASDGRPPGDRHPRPARREAEPAVASGHVQGRRHLRRRSAELAAVRLGGDPRQGVFEVDAAGSAGMLVRREVLDSIGDPWFQQLRRCGVERGRHVLCRRARSSATGCSQPLM